MLEGRPVLNQVFTDKAERTALRKNGGVVVKRSVLEMKDQPTRDTITLRILDQITVSNGFAVQRAQREKSVNQTFPMSYSDLISFDRRLEKCSANDHCEKANPSRFQMHVDLQFQTLTTCNSLSRLKEAFSPAPIPRFPMQLRLRFGIACSP
jgi:hypothetical protein